MIQSFRCRDTERLFRAEWIGRFQGIEQVARRKLRQLDAATELRDLQAFPGNRLEALKGDRRGQYSIRINDQCRLCSRWDGRHATDVEIVDYH